MAILKIAKLGNPILRRQADPIGPRQIKSADIQRLIDDMTLRGFSTETQRN